MKGTVHASATILIVEDDTQILALEQVALDKENFQTFGFRSTKGVDLALKSRSIDLIVMDRTLPDIDGADYVAYLRKKGIETPVLFVSDKVADHEVEEGFASGGDDYLRKPFNINEFIYRVKSLLRRSNHLHYDQLSYRDITLDLNSRKSYVANEEIELTKLEFNLLTFFIKNKNAILDRDYLLYHVWGDKSGTQKRKVNVTINRLRNKIDPDNSKNYIEPIRGIGYKFI
jgi:DNA-binding response OmpR family regulator